jgi:3-oxoacyl-[acyl-carrier-protein] synthase III
MQYQSVAIAGLAHELPPERLTSLALEERLAPLYGRLGLHPGRLELMTGIVERRFWPEPMRPSAIATRAGRRALEAADLAPERIGVLIHASVCRDFLEPATASVVHHALGLPAHAQAFDLSNACLGMLSAACMVANMIELGQVEAGLVVSGENGLPLLESTVAALLADPAPTRRSLKPALASLTIGSGGAALLLTRKELAPAAPRLLRVAARTASEHHTLCEGGVAQAGATGANAPLTMSTDAEALLLAGVSLAKETWAELRRSSPASGPDRVVTHQVGKQHDAALFEALGLPRELGFVTYDRLGNMGSASLVASLALAAEAGHVRAGQQVALLGIGSGLACTMAEVAW